MEEVKQKMDTMQQAEIFQLSQIIEEAEAMGCDPLGDLAQLLMQEISERKIRLEMVKHQQAGTI